MRRSDKVYIEWALFLCYFRYVLVGLMVVIISSNYSTPIYVLAIPSPD